METLEGMELWSKVIQKAQKHFCLYPLYRSLNLTKVYTEYL